MMNKLKKLSLAIFHPSWGVLYYCVAGGYMIERCSPDSTKVNTCQKAAYSAIGWSNQLSTVSHG